MLLLYHTPLVPLQSATWSEICPSLPQSRLLQHYFQQVEQCHNTYNSPIHHLLIASRCQHPIPVLQQAHSRAKYTELSLLH